MIKEFIKAFSLVFLAEIGDKSLIIAMYFSIHYLIRDVILGITLGVLANHGLAILLGKMISNSFPIKEMQFIAGLLFIFFGFITLKDTGLDEFKNNKNISPIITVGLAYFIGELGDKTQITAMTLAIESKHMIFVLMGTTLAMITTSGLGILIGSKMGDRIPETGIKIASSIIFIILGIAKIANYMPRPFLKLERLGLLITLILSLEILLIYRFCMNKGLVKKDFTIKKLADEIYKQTEGLNKILNKICLGENNCGKCQAEKCLIGYTKFILEQARVKQDLYTRDKIKINNLIKKDYDKDDVMEALILIIMDYEINGWEINPNYIINKIKTSLENILFGGYQIKGNTTKEYLKNLSKIDYDAGLCFENKIINLKENT